MLTWKDRIKGLQDTGMTLSEIANLIGLATSSVGDLATGRTESPRGAAALKLDQLHRSRCEEQPKKTSADRSRIGAAG